MDFIRIALIEDPNERASVEQLLEHAFLKSSINDYIPVMLSKTLLNLISQENSRARMGILA